MITEEIIEKAKKICFSSNPQDYIQFVGELAELESEQLPDNLDEAAKKWLESYCTNEKLTPAGFLGFKAGARWMAEQGETTLEEVYGCSDEITSEVCVNPTSVKVGDKVIVQIRKAE